MTQATAGQTVRIHYAGTLDDGSTFDSSIGRVSALARRNFDVGTPGACHIYQPVQEG